METVGPKTFRTVTVFMVPGDFTQTYLLTPAKLIARPAPRTKAANVVLPDQPKCIRWVFRYIDTTLTNAFQTDWAPLPEGHMTMQAVESLGQPFRVIYSNPFTSGAVQFSFIDAWTQRSRLMRIVVKP